MKKEEYNNHPTILRFNKVCEAIESLEKEKELLRGEISGKVSLIGKFAIYEKTGELTILTEFYQERLLCEARGIRCLYKRPELRFSTYDLDYDYKDGRYYANMSLDDFRIITEEEALEIAGGYIDEQPESIANIEKLNNIIESAVDSSVLKRILKKEGYEIVHEFHHEKNPPDYDYEYKLFPKAIENDELYYKVVWSVEKSPSIQMVPVSVVLGGLFVGDKTGYKKNTPYHIEYLLYTPFVETKKNIERRKMFVVKPK